MPVLRAVSASIETERPRSTRNRAIAPSSSRMEPELNLPTSAACLKRVDICAGLHHSDPFFRRRKWACYPLGTMLDERAKTLLKTLVERYIADGQPVGEPTIRP